VCAAQGHHDLVFIKTSKKIADIMTKQSAGPQFVRHRDYAQGYLDAINTGVAKKALKTLI
jgi:hypothetical protein